MSIDTSGNSRRMGTFILHERREQQQVFGELQIESGNTLLKLRDEHELFELEDRCTIFGKLHDLTRVSCLDCVSSGIGRAWKSGEGEYYFVNVTPHFVLTGSQHFDPKIQKLSSISFFVSDTPSVFDDVDAFGRAFKPSDIAIDAVIPKTIGQRTIHIGPSPQIAYFTGKTELATVEIDCGKLKVAHWLQPSMGDTHGITLKSKIMTTVDFSVPVTFKKCVECMMSFMRFMSLVAGRKQSIESISAQVAEQDQNSLNYLQVHWSFPPNGVDPARFESERPSSFDTPLNAIQRPDEFVGALRNWWSREPTWRTARARYQACLDRENNFDVDRLVAAANMFDLLPEDAVPVPSVLSPELEAAIGECQQILRQQPKSPERGDALLALKKIYNPALRHKILSRAKIVSSHIGDRFPELDWVVGVSVKCRNHFVHGGSDFDYPTLHSSLAFFIETLEFIFAASDLIQSGWEGSDWNQRPHTSGHWFTRFRAHYPIELERLKKATTEVSAST